MDAELQKWREEQKHLPEFMRDFHNCKRLFRGIGEFIVLEGDHPAKEVNWRQAHCYTIDVFLWFMARHGFTLQRSRSRHAFESLDDLLEELDRERRQIMASIAQQPRQSEEGEV